MSSLSTLALKSPNRTLPKYTCSRNWNSCYFILVYSQHVSAPTGHL
jgi:hypothetical protein